MAEFSWRLVSFKRTGRDAIHLGVLEKDRVIDLNAVLVAEGGAVPEGMRQLLERHPQDLAPWLEKAAARGKASYPLPEVTLQAPVTNPRMFYDFLGFEQHVRQIRERRGAVIPEIWYQRPAYYVGSVAPDKLFGPGPVTFPRFVEKPDYECELALIVGAPGRFTDEARAAQFIQAHGFFTLCNDWSARDYQKLDMELGLGVSHSKSIVGTSLGPCLVHASRFRFDAAGNPDIPVRLVVNGTTRAEANYQSVHWGFAKILAFLGRENIGVFPGDILGSGTIGNGCIAEFGPKMMDGKEVEPARLPWLRSGDEVTLSAEGIGSLTAKVLVS